MAFWHLEVRVLRFTKRRNWQDAPVIQPMPVTFYTLLLLAKVAKFEL